MPGNMQIDREDIARTRQTQTQTKPVGGWEVGVASKSDSQHMNCISCSVDGSGAGSGGDNLTFYSYTLFLGNGDKKFPDL